MAKKAILVGLGSWGEWWCKYFLPPNIEEGLVEVAAVVSRHPEGFSAAKQYLHMTEEQCFLDAEEAFRTVPADFCIIVVQSWNHEKIVDLAVKYGLHILSEKPIADTLDGAVRIADKVRKAGLKMAVTMSHRFDQDKTTLRAQLRSGLWGKLDYLICRFTCDCRKYGSWGEGRHQMRDPLMLEGAVHHLDILADLAGAPCEEIYASTWTPSWASFQGDCNGLVTMTFANGTHAVYEGAKSNAVTLNGWAHEYIRVESERGMLVLNQRDLEGFSYDDTQEWRQGREGEGSKIPLLEQPKWANTWLLEQYVQWLEGGKTMETEVWANLQSIALIEAAIQSSRTHQVVKVQELLQDTIARITQEV